MIDRRGPVLQQGHRHRQWQRPVSVAAVALRGWHYERETICRFLPGLTDTSVHRRHLTDDERSIATLQRRQMLARAVEQTVPPSRSQIGCEPPAHRTSRTDLHESSSQASVCGGSSLRDQHEIRRSLAVGTLSDNSYSACQPEHFRFQPRDRFANDNRCLK